MCHTVNIYKTSIPQHHSNSLQCKLIDQDPIHSASAVAEVTAPWSLFCWLLKEISRIQDLLSGSCSWISKAIGLLSQSFLGCEIGTTKSSLVQFAGCLCHSFYMSWLATPLLGRRLITSLKIFTEQRSLVISG